MERVYYDATCKHLAFVYHTLRTDTLLPPLRHGLVPFVVAFGRTGPFLGYADIAIACTS